METIYLEFCINAVYNEWPDMKQPELALAELAALRAQISAHEDRVRELERERDEARKVARELAEYENKTFGQIVWDTSGDLPAPPQFNPEALNLQPPEPLPHQPQEPTHE
jgi:hypothetical protein